VLSQQAPVGCGRQFVGHVVLMPWNTPQLIEQLPGSVISQVFVGRQHAPVWAPACDAAHAAASAGTSHVRPRSGAPPFLKLSIAGLLSRIGVSSVVVSPGGTGTGTETHDAQADPAHPRALGRAYRAGSRVQ
jgi:hypothetical protein